MKRSLNDLTVNQLKKRLDVYFSLFIRARDSDANGYIFCCTCGRLKKWKSIGGAECGHYSHIVLILFPFHTSNCFLIANFLNSFL